MAPWIVSARIPVVTRQAAGKTGCRPFACWLPAAKRLLTPRGLERGNVSDDDNRGLRNPASEGRAQNGALSDDSPPLDADFAAIVRAWPTLPEAVKAGIVAMVEAAKQA